MFSEYPVHQSGFSHVGFADNGDSNFPGLFRFFFRLSESFYAGSDLLHEFVDIFVVKRGNRHELICARPVEFVCLEYLFYIPIIDLVHGIDDFFFGFSKIPHYL